MKMKSTNALRLIPVAFAGLLAACTTPGKGADGAEIGHKVHHPEINASTSSSTGKSLAPTESSQRGMMDSMDMQSMCDMHKNMMSSKSPAERQAIMEQRMKSMSPEMRRQHMEMMESTCK